jgi:hypothetical protein
MRKVLFLALAVVMLVGFADAQRMSTKTIFSGQSMATGQSDTSSVILSNSGVWRAIYLWFDYDDSIDTKITIDRRIVGNSTWVPYDSLAFDQKAAAAGYIAEWILRDNVVDVLDGGNAQYRFRNTTDTCGVTSATYTMRLYMSR